MPKRVKEKYVYRIDSKYHHCWAVGIGAKESWGVTKSFFDAKCGGEGVAYKRALQYRDDQVKLLKSHLDGYASKGWREEWRDKENWSYLYIVASFGRNYKSNTKKFSVNKYGYDEAIRLAEKWHKNEVYSQK